MTHDVFAIARDIAALILLLGNFVLLILTIAGREASNRGVIRAGCWLTVGLIGIVTNGRGIFPNRWPAVFVVLITIGFWMLIRRAKRIRF
jgi:hypothetical protein